MAGPKALEGMDADGALFGRHSERGSQKRAGARIKRVKALFAKDAARCFQ